MTRRPHILVTNDDGFWAPGIQALARHLREVANVTIVAPQLEQSAKGHGITVNEPIRYREERLDGDFLGYSVLGTPADCVKIGVRELLNDEPDLVFSGINFGRNTGMNVLYSGTVAGAMEGAMYNIPSLALSLSYDQTQPEPDFEPAAKLAVRLLPIAEQLGLSHGIMLNVNFPALPLEQIKGVQITSQSVFQFRDVFDARKDPRGTPYFWLKGERHVVEETEEVDEHAVRAGYVSITPLRANLTAEHLMESLDQINFSTILKG